MNLDLSDYFSLGDKWLYAKLSSIKTDIFPEFEDLRQYV